MKAKDKKLLPQKATVITGYGIYAALVLATIMGTVLPFGQMLFNPHANTLNVSVLLVGLTAGALIPALLAYLIGDHSVKSKSRLSHHFNGVLFGLLAYWIMTIEAGHLSQLVYLSGIDTLPLRVILVNGIPILVAAGVALVLALLHIRSKQAKKDVIAYKPFGITLIALIAAQHIIMIVNNLQYAGLDIFTYIPLIATAVIGVISYISLRRSALGAYTKVVWSAVSVSVLYALLFVGSLLISSLGYVLNAWVEYPQALFLHYVMWALGLFFWGVYWTFVVKGLRKK